MYAAMTQNGTFRFSPEPMDDGLEEFEVSELPDLNGRLSLVDGKIVSIPYPDPVEESASETPSLEKLIDAILE